MPSVDILCLANSRKHAGRCVAGLRTDGKGWVRPVAPRKEGVLFERDYTLADRTHAGVLDVLRIRLVRPQPEPHQPENWIIDPARSWELIARPPTPAHLQMLRRFVVGGPDLLGNRGDRVPFNSFLQTPARASLALVRPTDLRWRLVRTRTGKAQTRALFRVGPTPYNLSVTDLFVEARLAGQRLGDHPVTSAGLRPDDEVLLTISLGEPFEEDWCCYKLVAAVIALPRPAGGRS